MKLLKRFGICLLLMFSFGLLMGANELIRIDVRSGRVRAESLPLDFPEYPQTLSPAFKKPDVRDMQTDQKDIPQYQFLSSFAEEELENLKNEN